MRDCCLIKKMSSSSGVLAIFFVIFFFLFLLLIIAFAWWGWSWNPNQEEALVNGQHTATSFGDSLQAPQDPLLYALVPSSTTTFQGFQLSDFARNPFVVTPEFKGISATTLKLSTKSAVSTNGLIMAFISQTGSQLLAYSYNSGTTSFVASKDLSAVTTVQQLLFQPQSTVGITTTYELWVLKGSGTDWTLSMYPLIGSTFADGLANITLTGTMPSYGKFLVTDTDIFVTLGTGVQWYHKTDVGYDFIATLNASTSNPSNTSGVTLTSVSPNCGMAMAVRGTTFLMTCDSDVTLPSGQTFTAPGVILQVDISDTSAPIITYVKVAERPVNNGKFGNALGNLAQSRWFVTSNIPPPDTTVSDNLFVYDTKWNLRYAGSNRSNNDVCFTSSPSDVRTNIFTGDAAQIFYCQYQKY